MHGVLAFGDSITNGGGELQWGVALQSWALWLARGLGLPYTGYAVDGATVREVVHEQIPQAERTSALGPGARYHLGCLYIGINDVRRDDWEPGAFAAAHRAALGYLNERCEIVLAVSVPARLGRPATAVRRIAALNAAIEAGAAATGAHLLDLRDFGARNHVMADRVHPTAFGQIAIAERALALLAAERAAVRVWPSTLISYETSWSGRLRGDVRYGLRALRRTLAGRRRHN